jgi:hypothetical protein
MPDGDHMTIGQTNDGTNTTSLKHHAFSEVTDDKPCLRIEGSGSDGLAVTGPHARGIRVDSKKTAIQVNSSGNGEFFLLSPSVVEKTGIQVNSIDKGTGIKVNSFDGGTGIRVSCMNSHISGTGIQVNCFDRGPTAFVAEKLWEGHSRVEICPLTAALFVQYTPPPAHISTDEWSFPAALFAESERKQAIRAHCADDIAIYGVTDAPPARIGKGPTPKDPAQVSKVRAIPAIFGYAEAGVGIEGYSWEQIGVRGTSINGFAGWFDGRVVARQVITTAGKNAAIPHPDGSHRLLYSMESPECWFEDFGTASLRGGKARVKLERDFAALIRSSDYHVFFTPLGDCNGLYVSARRGGAFEVRELNGGRSNVRFDYRIVGRRKDISAPRLAKLKLPNYASGVSKKEIDRQRRHFMKRKRPRVTARSTQQRGG